LKATSVHLHASRDPVFSRETRLAFAPGATFALLRAERPVGMWRSLGVSLLVMGVAIPIMAVQRVTIGLVAATAISWSFTLAIQVLMGALVVASVPSRRIGMRPALDLWFAGHLPYSLWLLATAALVANLPFDSLEMVIALGLIPSVWTTAIVSAFCRVVLGTSRGGAGWRAGCHFIAAWAIALQYVAWAAGGWFQVTGSVAGFFE
jgi:hypothetical protein